MSTARHILISRLTSFREAAKDPALQNGPLTDTVKNEIARFLRNGLQIMIFCTLEDFLRARAIELFSTPDFTRVKFQDLPVALQKTLTMEALEAILHRGKIDSSISDPVIFCVDEIKMVGSSTAQAMPYSTYAFGKLKSNFSYEDIERLLISLKVSTPATSISSITTRCGYNITGGVKEAFKNFAGSRHSAAHDPSCAIEVTDLLESIKFAVAFCLAFDVLATVAVTRLSHSKTEEVAGNRLCIRVIYNRKTSEWAECILSGTTRGRAKRVHRLRETAYDEAWRRCKSEEMLVEQDLSGLPVGWRI